MPQAPPSEAVSPTDTGVSIAAARNRCATPLVVNRPPWANIVSSRTPSSLVSTSIPIRRVASAAYSWVRMKVARSKVLSGVRRNSGRPSSRPVIGSPER